MLCPGGYEDDIMTAEAETADLGVSGMSGQVHEV